MLKDKNGFTLMELLIVIPLVAIISAALLTNYLTQVKKGHDSRKKEDLQRIKFALEDYYTDKNCYPTSLPQCGQPFLTQSGKTILPVFPCQPDGMPYIYDPQESSCPQNYCLYVNLENLSDSAIGNAGCLEGCGKLKNYNFGVCSENRNP